MSQIGQYQKLWGAVNYVIASLQLSASATPGHKQVTLFYAAQVLIEIAALKKVASDLGILQTEDFNEHALAIAQLVCPPSPAVSETCRSLASWLTNTHWRQPHRNSTAADVDVNLAALVGLRSESNHTAEIWKAVAETPGSLMETHITLNKAKQHFPRNKSISTDVEAKAFLSQAPSELHQLFPSHVKVISLIHAISASDCEEMVRLALDKYKQFQLPLSGSGAPLTSEETNNIFFAGQVTSDQEHSSGRGMYSWPELYAHSKPFRLLKNIAVEAAAVYLSEASGVDVDKARPQLMVSIWASVYVNDGAQIRYHDHPLAIVSGAFYPDGPGGTSTPLAFADPRGSDLYSYVSGFSERKSSAGQNDSDSSYWEPKPPFHRPVYVHPQQGDMVLFPPWMLHRVPPHYGTGPRVAFAFNVHSKPGTTLHAWGVPLKDRQPV